jgi:hypothetical protein
VPGEGRGSRLKGEVVTVRDRQQRILGLRPRRLRPAMLLLGLLVCLLLLPTATANADVMAKYRTKYKNKLTYYRNMMDGYSDTNFVAWKQAVESTSNQLTIALADPEHPENIQIVKQSALDQRSLLQDSVKEMRDKMYANIAAFKARAVDWFRTRADKNRFKARLTMMRGGFTTLFSADEGLMKAFYGLGMNADVGGCANEVMGAEMTRTTAETTFDKGWRQLLALE